MRYFKCEKCGKVSFIDSNTQYYDYCHYDDHDNEDGYCLGKVHEIFPVLE